jgi:16S rRNA processing protein RimM
LVVELHGDDEATLLGAREVTLAGEAGEVPFRVEGASRLGSSRTGHPRVRLELAGIDSRERAQRWVGSRLCVREVDLPPLGEGEYYQRELLGLRCELEDGTVLGSIREIQGTPAADVLVVIGEHAMLRIPAEEGILLRVERERGRAVVRLPEGFLLPTEP